MAEIKKLFKWTGEKNFKTNFTSEDGNFSEYASNYYLFKSVDKIIEKGAKIPEYEISIDEKHPIFANMEVKMDDVNDTFTVDYEITFDSEKGKIGNSPNNKRQYEKKDPITLKEIKKDKSNVRVCEKCQKEFKAMGAEDKCDNCKDNRERERERERAKLPNYELGFPN